jgi:hypothetical protein
VTPERMAELVARWVRFYTRNLPPSPNVGSTRSTPTSTTSRVTGAALEQRLIEIGQLDLFAAPAPLVRYHAPTVPCPAQPPGRGLSASPLAEAF